MQDFVVRGAWGGHLLLIHWRDYVMPCVCGRRQLAAKLSEFPTKFLLPLSARMSCSGLVVEKCRVMDSKQVCCSRLATEPYLSHSPFCSSSLVKKILGSVDVCWYEPIFRGLEHIWRV